MDKNNWIDIFQKRYTESVKEAHKKMLNIVSYQGNGNQKHK